MKAPSPQALLHYAAKCLGLQQYLHRPGDGRRQPRIPAHALLWAILLGRLPRENSFHAVEQLVHCRCRAMCVSRSFGNDALSYFTERLDPDVTRAALIATLHRAKRNKAFQAPFIGLAIDGTTAGHSAQQGCVMCRPQRNAQKEVIGYAHQMASVSVVGTGLPLPFDAEPHGPGDSEYAAGQPVLLRAQRQLGAPLCRLSGRGWRVRHSYLLTHGTARRHSRRGSSQGQPAGTLSGGRAPLHGHPPTRVYRDGKDRVEIWDADDFAPWETLDWDRVRVIRYRQHKPDKTLIEAQWLTNLPTRRFGSLSLYRIAKSRWEIENQGFNDGKNRYRLEHICHHHPNSILMVWLLVVLSLVLERLYRIRYLHRGTHPVPSADQLCRLLWLSLSRPSLNTS